LVGATDVLRAPPAGGGRLVEDWVEVSRQFQRFGGARDAHQRVIGEVISRCRPPMAPAGADVGFGRDLFCDL